MNPFQIHQNGDCWPETCIVCAQECDACGNWHHECTCPTLPLDEEESA